MNEQRIPRERLNQIARRKLEALGIACKLSPDGQRLEGRLDIPPGQLANPTDGRPLERVDFAVAGHDHLVLLGPPAVRGLPPQPFFDLPSAAKVIEQIRRRVQQRAAAVQQLADRLRGWDIGAEIDPGRLRVTARLELAGTGAVRLEGDERGLFAVEIIRPGRGPVAIEPLAVDLTAIDDRTDLELQLGDAVTRAKERPAAQPAPPTRADGEARPSPAAAAGPAGARRPADVPTSRPAEPITLGRLVRLLGEDTAVLPGAVLQKDLRVGGQPVRLAIRADGPQQLTGKLVSPDGTLWTGQLDPDRFPGVEDFAAGQLGDAAVEPAPAAAPAAPPAAPPGPQTAAEPPPALAGESLSPGQALPVVGEIWVMGCLVERDDGQEVRYVGIDVDGQPFGAQRILPKDVFERVFHQVSHGVYRLPVEIAAVSGNRVTYHQLDAERRRTGEPRTSRLTPFLSNFEPEAAAY
jgi:hypothetical protein